MSTVLSTLLVKSFWRYLYRIETKQNEKKIKKEKKKRRKEKKKKKYIFAMLYRDTFIESRTE